MRTNRLKQKLREGGRALGTGIVDLRGRGLFHTLTGVGIDFVLVCAEHSAFGLETVVGMVAEAHAAGLTPIVRIPDLTYERVTRLLDNGCQSLLLPHAKSGTEVRRFVEFAKYHPDGQRGCAIYFGGSTEYETVDVVSAMAHANANTLLGVVVETREAVEGLEDFLAPGIDFVLFGLQDLSQSYGVPGRYDDPRIREAEARLRALCGERGIATMGTAESPETVAAAVERGDTLVLYGNDLLLLRCAAAHAADAFRAAFAGLTTAK